MNFPSSQLHASARYFPGKVGRMLYVSQRVEMFVICLKHLKTYAHRKPQMNNSLKLFTKFFDAVKECDQGICTYLNPVHLSEFVF